MNLILSRPAVLRSSLILVLSVLLAACGPDEVQGKRSPPPEPTPAVIAGPEVPSPPVIESAVEASSVHETPAPPVSLPPVATPVMTGTYPVARSAPPVAVRRGPILPMSNLYGATMLQTREVKLDSPLARESIDDLHRLGANAIVLIPFMKQAHARADRVETGDAVTDEQLMAGADAAHAAGMRVVLKPQILVGGAWAGEINPGNPHAWDHWFETYQRQILRYAEIAQLTRAEVFVIGTELKMSDRQPHWRRLIGEVRKVYGGKLTYAAHNVDGLEQFAHWDQLDMMSVTLYPSLGRSDNRAEMRGTMQQVVRDLERIHLKYGKPLLVAEIGIPSVIGAYKMPWDYSKKRCDAPPDVELQATVIDLWLEVLNRPWVNGVLVWNWYSDPYAGGRHDNDYTVQHKPAESVLRCRWTGECRG